MIRERTAARGIRTATRGEAGVERDIRGKWARAVMALALLAIVIEQYPVGTSGGDVTDHLYLFTSLSDALKLSGLYVNPMELLLGGVLIAMLVSPGRKRLPRSRVAAGLGIWICLVALGALHGLAAGGDYKMVLWEIRPTLYVSLMFLFASQLDSRVETIAAMLWVFVAGVAFKAGQGLLLMPAYFGAHPRPEYLLSHEDSLLFALYIALVVGLWLFHWRSRLRTWATALLPLVVLVNVVNNRRTSWAILGAILAALVVLAWIRVPDRRRLIAGVVAVVAVFSAVYLPVYWNKTGLLAGPAEAVRSQFTPDLREQLSDLYRKQENANLVFNIHMSPVIGAGYGVKIDYALPLLADLADNDPFLNYIPHNDVLYVWLRVGYVGALAFWSFIGVAFLSACRLLRAADPRLALFGSFTVCALIAYLIIGYLDLGFWWFRVAIVMGWLLGGLEVARRTQAGDEARAKVAAHAESTYREPERKEASPVRRRPYRPRAVPREPALRG